MTGTLKVGPVTAGDNSSLSLQVLTFAEAWT